MLKASTQSSARSRRRWAAGCAVSGGTGKSSAPDPDLPDIPPQGDCVPWKGRGCRWDHCGQTLLRGTCGG